MKKYMYLFIPRHVDAVTEQNRVTQSWAGWMQQLSDPAITEAGGKGEPRSLTASLLAAKDAAGGCRDYGR